jgi:hypothetical protein
MLMRRGRPLLAAAMIGGAGYLAGRRGAERAGEEADQDRRIANLEARRAEEAPASSSPRPAGGGDDLVASLQRLADLNRQGALSDSEFERAKQKLLSGG